MLRSPNSIRGVLHGFVRPVASMAVMAAIWVTSSALALPADAAMVQENGDPASAREFQSEPIAEGVATERLAPKAPIDRRTSSELVGMSPAEIEAQIPALPTREITARDIAPKPTGASLIMEGRVGVDITPGSQIPDADDARAMQVEATERQAVDAAAEAMAAANWPQRVDAAIGDDGIVIVLIALGALVLGLMLFGQPIRQFRMGQHLARITSVFEEVERTRSTMPIGAGGGIDSLPLARQARANTEFEQALAYLKIYPRHEVTRELVKNAQLAERMGRPIRVVAIGRLIETLVQKGVALDIDDFMKSYA